MKLIFSTLVVLLAGFGVYHYSSKRSSPPRSDISKTSPSRTPQTAAADPRVKYGAVSCLKDSCSLTLEIRVPEVCHFGDYNFMKVDLEKASDKPVFRLSVEPLISGESSFQGVGVEVDFKSINGFRVTLPLPRFKNPTQLGVFLCKDAKDEKRCAGKPYLEAMGWITEMSKSFKGTPYRSPDRIYFFQYLLFESESRVMAFNDENAASITDDIFKTRLDYLVAKDSANTDVKTKAMEKIKAISRALSSLPLELETGQVALIVPKSKRCQQEEPPPPLVPSKVMEFEVPPALHKGGMPPPVKKAVPPPMLNKVGMPPSASKQ